ncbi:hypothetical protein PHMEG_00016080 [Phytophthora megakarya]|uniref:Uncharacterized protein n=1 Tax=Phytophthora megakarya TaxID=4795 RepID=A0A225W057_9STRA|nr:hypothetical protein PHMEG_00016080 [Phytophthora megakarya]
MCCSLQDVLYGLVASDPAEFKLRAVLMDNKVESDVEVKAITAPSKEEPFQFMGVTRYVVNHRCLRRPHEYVLVAATGEVSTSCGEHLGYEIYQSVSMPTWPVNKRTTRKQMVQARLLRELSDGTVGVYYKIIVDSTSFMPNSVLQASLWNMDQDFWNMAPRCADAKKLYYFVEHRNELNLSAQRLICAFTCGVCGCPLLKRRRRIVQDIAMTIVYALTGSATSAPRCVLCSTYLCSKSRCCSIRQLVRIDRQNLDTDRQTVALCTSCADVVRSVSAVEIARRGLQEIQATFKEKEAPYAGSCGKHRNQQPTV